MRLRVRDNKNNYKIVEPLNNLGNGFGFVMVCNPKGEVLKFFVEKHVSQAHAYMDYVSLSKWEKVKYWLNHKRGE